MGSWVIVTGDVGERGGQDRANLALASYLCERGDLVHLVSHEVDPGLAAHPAARVHRVPRPLGSHLAGSPLLDRAGRAVARRALSRDPGARVVVNGGNCLWPDVNWVHLVHRARAHLDDDAPLAVRLKNRVGGLLDLHRERVALTRARLVLANSRRTRDDLVEKVGVDPSRVVVQYLGSDPRRYSRVDDTERDAARAELGIPPGTPAVAFVGALGHDRRKGLDTLLRAWRQLCQGGSWDGLLLAAGGGALERWRRDVERMDLGERVRLLGWIDRVPALLAAADLLVSPTRYEPYGLNVQEALCRGVPAIVSAAAGVAERYPPALADLLLPDPDDASDLAARIRGWRSNPNRYRPATETLGARLRDFTWRDMAARIVEIVERAGAQARQVSA